MSDTIKMHHYPTRQAALLQQRPSDIISAAENTVNTFGVAHFGTGQVVCNGDQTQTGAASVVSPRNAGKAFGKVLTTAGTMAYVLSVSLPTTTPELFVVPDETQDENIWSHWAGQTKEALQKAASKERRPSTATARFRVERLAALQATFGFTTQDLASVLGISRPQLYKWLDAANDIRLQEASRVRLSTVERIAREWTLRSKAPLSAVSREALIGGGTIFDMMSAVVIDEAAIVSGFDELVAKLQTKPKTRSQRLREAGFTRRASSLPSDE
ncbi:MAG: helix-turn-helix transcriptional regulator [Methylococcus sp.]|nr:helix-turn-helix transcriptional regulator [Methylococcus sp.]